IADGTSLPIVLYNIPGRCGVDIGPDTVMRLATECRNIVSIKEASGSVERISELRGRLPEAFTILSGDDSLTLPFMSVGAVRVVLVGAAGRMGKTIVDLAKNDPKIDIVAQCDLGDVIDPAMKKSDVTIDFSHPDAIEEICRAALQHRQALVIGTTGHSAEQR